MVTEVMDLDISEYLDSPEMIQEYINAAIETGDSDLLRLALGDVAKAKGMTDIAKTTNLSRQNLYKAFSSDGSPKLDTVQKVLHALGLRLKVEIPN